MLIIVGYLGEHHAARGLSKKLRPAVQANIQRSNFLVQCMFVTQSTTCLNKGGRATTTECEDDNNFRAGKHGRKGEFTYHPQGGPWNGCETYSAVRYNYSFCQDGNVCEICFCQDDNVCEIC